MERIVKYERNLTGSYMLAEAGEESFDEKLIMRKKLPGILEMKRCSVDGSGQFWYTITGKQSLDTLYGIRKASLEELKDLILQICIQLEVLENNLISADCLVLNPQLVFMDNQTRKIYFMLDPEEKIPVAERFRELMEYLLTQMDHSNQKSVKDFYELYQISLNEGYSIADIRRTLQKPDTEKGQIQGQNEREQIQKSYTDMDTEHLTSEAFNWQDISDWEPENNTTGKKKKLDKKEEKERKKEEKRKQKELKKEQKLRDKNAEDDKKTGGFVGWIRRMKNSGRDKTITEGSQMGEYGFDPEEMFSSYYAAVQSEEDDDDELQDETRLVNIADLHPEGIFLYEGNEGYESLQIRDGEMVFGKGKDADLRVNRNTISKYHARITKDPEGNYYLEDLNSTNGTYINEKIVNYREKAPLKINDVIRFADLKYRFI